MVGPTGSGKSSTMYTLIRELLADRTNLITLEDPVAIPYQRRDAGADRSKKWG